MLQMNVIEKSNGSLSADTETVLLLCGRFGGEKGERYSPLSQKEYEALARWLLERKKRPADLLQGGESGNLLNDLIQARLDRSRIEFLLGRGTALAFAVEKWQRSGLWVLSRSDALYPQRLKKKLGQSAPPLLYGAGNPSLLHHGGLAIVGARDANETALQFSRDVAGACAREGIAVISGGARGVDSAAMQGAGETDGTVVGVLSSDLLKASVNRTNRIGLKDGRLVLVSPFNPEAAFNAGNAMARNRYIYALSDYALVVDSAEGEGGTWNGAIENIRNGWVPLFVRMPGDKPGNGALVMQGGKEFAFSSSGSTSIREFLESDAAFVPKQAEIMVAQFAYPDRTATSAIDLQGSESEPESAEQDQVDGAKGEAALPDSPANLDMFSDFCAKLPFLLTNDAKSAEDIQAALGLDKGQTRAWLEKAIEHGWVEKTARPTGYRLVKQCPLC
ncbi:MAG: hypothetical protein V7606_2609 [Burkholderiales bacterium]